MSGEVYTARMNGLAYRLTPQENYRYKSGYKGGYYRVSIADENGKRCYKLIHQIVAELFLGKHPGDGLEIHHINGRHGINDNGTDNLILLTVEQHRAIHGYKKKEE